MTSGPKRLNGTNLQEFDSALVLTPGSSLSLTGTSNDWMFTAVLAAERVYHVRIQAADLKDNAQSAALTADMVNPNYSTSEAENSGYCFGFRVSGVGFIEVLLAFLIIVCSVRADQFKADNNSNLELGTSWVGGVAPSGADNAIWDARVATAANCTNNLGSAVTWNGIIISNPAAPVIINGNSGLTLINGINLGNSSVNLTLNCGAVNLGANQTWDIPSGRTLTTGSATNSGSVNSPNNGNWIITKSGSGTWVTSGTGDNGSIGLVVNGGTVIFNKNSNGGTHAVGGPGLTINTGGTVRITGTGGDQIYDAGGVTLAAGGLLDMNGNSETIGFLAGAGGTVDNTAAGKPVFLTIGGALGNSSSSFAGVVQNSAIGARLGLIKAGTGTLTLRGANTYNGGTTVAAGTLALATTNNVAMAYTNSGGILSVTATSSGSPLQMTTLALGSSSPQLSFNLGGVRNLAVPLISDSGNLILNGNVVVNVMNAVQSGSYVLLHYAGTRSGVGNFVAGVLPTGASITDDTVNKNVILDYASPLAPRVIVPTLNTNEVVVAITTPQQFGAKGDGISDDTEAFQNAMNAVYNSGGFGGGTVFVPAGQYAFYTNLTIPTGVTLHGDWADWTKGANGLTGTTFKVYFGAGQTTNAAFISMSGSTALRDINFWYPDQNPANITPYPFTIRLSGDCVVQNVALVNSYQGIQSAAPSGGDKHILRTVVGSPLYKGIDLDQIFDVCHAEDVRFSPDIWPASLLTNAPAPGGPHAAWMKANGEAMRLLRVDGEMCIDTYLSGYGVGIAANAASNGQPGAAFYSGAISNCGTALLAQDMPTAFGLMFAGFTLDGDIAINRTNTADGANTMFDHCTIIGRHGPAVSSTGLDWRSWMQFQNCTVSNALLLAGPGVFNVVDSALLGSTQCVLSANATRAAFTGCTFGPTTNLLNYGNASNLQVNPKGSVSNAFPTVCWTNVVNDFLARKAARTNLHVVTDAQWGAYGDGVTDDTVAIQAALTAAGSAGGGIVYLPAGKYHLTNTLDVPPGVELRGAFEMRHGTMPGADGHAKGTVLQPYGGQGTTDGPPAIALEANGGMVGVTISYETQNTNCYPFPAAIQGRGANVYAIGVCSPNPYAYVDLDTYTCTNHYFDMVDGWALNTGYRIGNGSAGTIVDCHDNWTYWVANYDSQSSLPQNIQAPVLDYVAHNLQMYVLGNCSEMMMKDFSIIENVFMHCVAEAGVGPTVTLINNYCDATIRGFVLDAAAPCQLNAVNIPMTTFNFGNFADLAEATVAVLSTTNFHGTARFRDAVLWGGTYLDFNINGGDVGFDMVHMENHSFIGSIVNRGIFHLVNNSAYITYNGTSNFPPYNVAFGVDAGVAGKTSDFIGCYAYNGCSIFNANTSNPVNCWNDYALATYSVLNPNLPVLYNSYPNGSALFQYTNLLSFSAMSPAGIAASNIAVTVNGLNVTNLVFNNAVGAWNVSYTGLLLNRAYTVVVTATDNAGQVASSAFSFDTFNPNNYTFEAEDFDYTSGSTPGLFIDNPQTNAFAGLGATDGVDCHNASGGGSSYRPNPSGLATENANDLPRPAYASGLQDYDVGWNNRGNWGNYTRHYPSGIYNLYMRAASPNGSPVTTDAASLAVVTSGFGTPHQTTTRLGTFNIPNTGDWHHFTWVPLLDGQGNLAQLTNSGLSKTFRVTTDNGGYNANFYALISVTAPCQLTGIIQSSNVSISIPTQPGLVYQLEYTTDLATPVWLPLGTAITGDGSVRWINDIVNAGGRFYRVRIQ